MRTTLTQNLLRLASAVFLVSLMMGGQICHAQTDGLSKAWEAFAPKQLQPGKQKGTLGQTWERYAGKVLMPGRSVHPGRTVGNDPALAGFMEISGWQYRGSSYEMYFADSRTLARCVYGLALQSGDIDETMSQERFEKNVRGFHYSTAQVCAWVNAVLSERMPLHTDEERQLLFWLLKDGVVAVQNGIAVPGIAIHHVLAAAPGKKRSFLATLRHERLHVLWDEDPKFAAEYRARWNAMTGPEKQAVRDRLRAYAQGNEAQLIEEWAIAEAEDMPEAQRIALVGL